VQVAWRNQRQRRTSIPHQAFLKQRWLSARMARAALWPEAPVKPLEQRARHVIMIRSER
jgi:hypothetical protein